MFSIQELRVTPGAGEAFILQVPSWRSPESRLLWGVDTSCPHSSSAAVSWLTTERRPPGSAETIGTLAYSLPPHQPGLGVLSPRVPWAIIAFTSTTAVRPQANCCFPTPGPDRQTHRVLPVSSQGRCAGVLVSSGNTHCFSPCPLVMNSLSDLCATPGSGELGGE